MASALRDNGSTRRWRRLRAHYAQQLPCPCWRCGEPINPGDNWELGHLIDRADGGEDDQLAPEHAKCNHAASARRTNALTRQPWAWPPAVVGSRRETATPLRDFDRDVLAGLESRDRDW